MKEVIKFRVTLFREQFSIYGISNVLVFTFLALFLTIGVKVGLIVIGGYNMISMLLGGITFSFAIGVIFPKDIERKSQFVKIFFDKIDVVCYKRYLTYYKFVIYQIILLYLLFPTDLSYVGSFAFIFSVIQILTMLSSLIYMYGNEKNFNIVKSVVSIILCLIIILMSRDLIRYPSDIVNNSLVIILNISVSLLMVLYTYKIIGKNVQKKNSVHLFRMSYNLPIIENNKDFLFVFRKNKLAEPIFIIILSQCISYYMKEQNLDAFLTYLFSFSYLFYTIYIELLKYENKSFALIYSYKDIKRLKKEKVRNTIKIAVFVFGIVFIPMSLLASFSKIAIAFLLALVFFIVNTKMKPFSFEKREGYKRFISDKDKIIFILLFVVEILVIEVVFLLLGF